MKDCQNKTKNIFELTKSIKYLFNSGLIIIYKEYNLKKSTTIDFAWGLVLVIDLII